MSDCANICGFSENDLDTLFADRIESIEKEESIQQMLDASQFESLRDAIFYWYDGYTWNGTDRVFNPFSLLSFFDKQVFKPYWYVSGISKFLIDLLKEKPQMYIEMQNAEVDELSFDLADVTELPLLYLLFFTGYLTIKEVDYSWLPIGYKLCMPNHEIQDAFSKQVLTEFTNGDMANVSSALNKMKEFLRAGEPEKLEPVLKGLFASIPPLQQDDEA
jgi:hypothetical protein